MPAIWVPNHTVSRVMSAIWVPQVVEAAQWRREKEAAETAHMSAHGQKDAALSSNRILEAQLLELRAALDQAEHTAAPPDTLDYEELERTQAIQVHCRALIPYHSSPHL